VKFLDAAEMVVETKSACLIRPRKGVDAEYDVKEAFTGKKRGWALLDLFTASAVTAAADKVGVAERAKMNRMSPSSLTTLAFKFVSGGNV
jgi:hypothetical protein